MTHKQIPKAEFKLKALEILRQIEESGNSVIVMDHGVPVLEIKPCRSAGRRPLDALRQSLVSYLDPTCAVAEVDWTDGG